MSACIFCEIVAERIPANKIFENEDCLAFLDIFPAGKGHTLVIPKKHFMDIHDADQLTYSLRLLPLQSRWQIYWRNV